MLSRCLWPTYDGQGPRRLRDPDSRRCGLWATWPGLRFVPATLKPHGGFISAVSLWVWDAWAQRADPSSPVPAGAEGVVWLRRMPGHLRAAQRWAHRGTFSWWHLLQRALREPVINTWSFRVTIQGQRVGCPSLIPDRVSPWCPWEH